MSPTLKDLMSISPARPKRVSASASSAPEAAKRIGNKLTVGVGFLVCAGGMFYLSQTSTVDASYGTLLPGLLLWLWTLVGPSVLARAGRSPGCSTN